MHKIELVDDEALPEGQDFVVVGAPGTEAVVFQRASAEPKPELWAEASASVQQQDSYAMAER